MADAAISVGSVGLLVAGMFALDQRSSALLSRVTLNGPSDAAAGLGGALHAVGRGAWDQAAAHAPLAVFACAAAVLVFAMLRLR